MSNNLLKALRESNGLTQSELADSAGVTRECISLIENGKNKPSVALAKKLGQILKVDWSNFFGR